MIRLLIADDHAIVREGLRRLLGECPDMEVREEASSGDEILAKLDALDVDVALIDLSMPGPGFFELMRHLHDRRPGVAILVLSMQPEDMYAVRALRAGAAGYVTKDRSPSELATAIRRVAAGGRYISADLAESLALGHGLDPNRQGHDQLSNREFQVLCRIGAGDSVKEIAARLDLSPKTVSTYRTRILEKLELDTTAELIRYAVEHKLA